MDNITLISDTNLDIDTPFGTVNVFWTEDGYLAVNVDNTNDNSDINVYIEDKKIFPRQAF